MSATADLQLVHKTYHVFVNRRGQTVQARPDAAWRTAQPRIRQLNGLGPVLMSHVAIVTGGGRGLGQAMVPGLAQAGIHVVATAARERTEIEAIAEEVRPVTASRECHVLVDTCDSLRLLRDETWAILGLPASI